MRLPTETPALLLGLIGEGIGQSLSPALYEEEAAQHGILCLYQRIDLDELRLTPAALPELLTPDEQKLLRDAAVEAAVYQRQVSRDAASKALETLKQHGMQVTEMSPEDMDKMRAMVKPVVDKYAQEVGEASIQSMYSELDKIRQQKQ